MKNNNLPKFIKLGNRCILHFLDNKWETYERTAAKFEHFIVSDMMGHSIGFCDSDTCRITDTGVSITASTTWIDLPKYEYGDTWIAYEVL